nr:uncharacterized protein LOC116429216 isoform X2 [Nomia melanderi]
MVCLILAVACSAARVPRISEPPYFQNYQGVFPGSNAGGFHDVQGSGAAAPFLGDFRSHEGNLGSGHNSGNGFFPNQGFIGSRPDLANHLAPVPFGDVGGNQGNFKAPHYGRFNRDYDY